MEKGLPKRKHPRLKEYDYRSAGAYFITICTQNKKPLLSRIVGRGLAPAETEYTCFGQIAEKELLALEQRYPCVRVDQYVIMPDHLHAILVLNEDPAGASPRPTVMDIVCAFKSITTRKCKALSPIDKLFQPSFYEHVIRNHQDYEEIAKYIQENPMRWLSNHEGNQ